MVNSSFWAASRARLQHRAGVVVAVFHVLDEQGQQRLALAGPLGGALVDAPAAAGEAAELARRDRAGSDPPGPYLRLVGRPGVQVVVEAADDEHDRVLLAAFPAIVFDADGVPPCLVGSGGDPQVGLPGADGLDVLPEVVGQREDERLEAGVVQVGGAALEVVDEQLTGGPPGRGWGTGRRVPRPAAVPLSARPASSGGCRAGTCPWSAARPRWRGRRTGWLWTCPRPAWTPWCGGSRVRGAAVRLG